MLATMIGLGATDAARTDNCLTEPTGAAAPGTRWFYHSDRATNRKCWYLVEAGPRAPAEAPPPSPEGAQQSPFGTFFSSWAAGFGSSPAPQPDTAGGDPRTSGDTHTLQAARPQPARLQPARPDSIKSDDDGAAGKQPRAVRRPDVQAELAPKPHRPAPARTAGASAVSDAERDALFQEFLRWKERQPK
ncbi:MAG TPA: hypothetical protein VIY51_15650 [Xanthobacteraceae bacterium]